MIKKRITHFMILMLAFSMLTGVVLFTNVRPDKVSENKRKFDVASAIPERIEGYDRFTINVALDDQSLDHSFDESMFSINGAWAFCADPFTGMKYTERTPIDARSYVDPNSGETLSEDVIRRIAIGVEYVSKCNLAEAEKYYLTQLVIWRSMSESLGWNINHTHVSPNDIDIETQGNVLKDATEAFVNTPAEIVKASATIWIGDGQPLIQTSVDYKGYLKLIKSSESPEITDDNSQFTFEGITYGVYADEGCRNKVGELVCDKTGNTNSLVLDEGTYYVKEIDADTKRTHYLANEEVQSIKVVKKETTTITTGIAVDSVALGKVYLKKSSNEEAITSGNRLYTFDGIRYGIYSDSKCTDLVETLKCNASGKTQTATLFPGDYYVKEISADTANTHYLLNEDKIKIEIVSGETLAIDYDIAVENPVYGKISVLLQKKDAITKSNTAQGDGTLQGAEYRVSYYDMISDTDPEADGVRAKRKWTFRTDASGKILFNESYKVGGDEFYKNKRGDICIPIGTVTIKETKAPQGYLLDDSVTVSKIIANKNGEISITKLALDGKVVEEMPIMGGVSVVKYDAELNASEAIGGDKHIPNVNASSLEGIEFTITNKSQKSISVKGKAYAPNAVVMKISTKWDDAQKAYIAKTGNKDLPYGTYSIRETKSNASYLQSDSTEYVFAIRNNGEIVTADTSNNLMVYRDYVKRGEVKFIKVQGESEKRLSVAFAITNDATGETHVMVTDENGMADSSNSWNAHSTRTNANDALLSYGESPIPKDAMDPLAGVWFAAGEDGHIGAVNNSFGALPYGSYTIKELLCEDNVGNELLSFGFKVSRNTTTYPIDLGTITNDTITTEKHPVIWTESFDRTTMDRMSAIGDEIAISDRVHLSNLVVGREYQIKGSLCDYVTGEPILAQKDGVYRPITGEVSFVAEEMACDIELPLIEFGKEIMISGEKRSVEGLRGVIYISATYQGLDGGFKTVEYNDPDDALEWIYFPIISTSAKDLDTGTNSGNPKESAVVVDVVSYENLIEGKSYKVTGTLMQKDSGEPVIDEEGNPICAETEFVAESSFGNVELTFEFDAHQYAGSSVVAFESLYYNDILIATHHDIDDMDQTVNYPKIWTTASDKATGGHEGTKGKESIIVDTVFYNNLVPTEEYTIKGRLMDKQNNIELLDGEGNEYTSEVTFVPEESDGSIDLEFVVDSENLHGKTVVAFERLFHNDIIISSHEDINDDNQSIYYEQDIPDEPVVPNDPVVPEIPETPDVPDEPEVIVPESVDTPKKSDTPYTETTKKVTTPKEKKKEPTPQSVPVITTPAVSTLPKTGDNSISPVVFIIGAFISLVVIVLRKKGIKKYDK